MLTEIVDSLPGQIAYWDRDLICRYANRTYFEWFGQPPETIIGMSMQDLLGAELFASNQPVLQGILRGEPQSFLRPISRADGSSAKVQVEYVPDLGADGTVAGFYVSVNDVTVFKRIEEQLREKEAELTAQVARRDDAISWLKMAEEIAHVGHWRVILPSGVVTWSDEMYRIHGVTPASYTPEFDSAQSFYCREDRTRIEKRMQRARLDGLPYEDMGRIRRPDGEVRHVSIRGMATQAADGLSSTIFGVIVDVTDQQKTEHALRVANDRLEAIAHMDGLTGIDNRRRFDEALELAWRAASRTGQALSVVLLDVDHFKAYNDTYGHQAGDECLRAVAGALRSITRRPQDIVARYGGEEFTILLPATDRAQATLVAERARSAVETLARTHQGSRSGLVTISAGVGSIQAIRPHRHRQEQLIAEADAMLYRAKDRGRNVVVSSDVAENRRLSVGL